MSLVTDRIQPADVIDAQTFADYAQSFLGIPYPSQKDLAILRKVGKEFFAEHPGTDWQTLVKTLHWMKSRNRRVANCYAVPRMFRYAWAAGCFPELDPGQRTDSKVETAIEQALVVETDPDWRRRLLLSRGLDAREAVLNAWRQNQRLVAA